MLYQIWNINSNVTTLISRSLSTAQIKYTGLWFVGQISWDQTSPDLLNGIPIIELNCENQLCQKRVNGIQMF